MNTKPKTIGPGGRVIYRLHKNHTPRIGTVLCYTSDSYGAGWTVLSDHDERHYRVSDKEGVMRIAQDVDERWHSADEKARRKRNHEQSQDMTRNPAQRSSYRPTVPAAPPVKAKEKPADSLSIGGEMEKTINQAAKK